jgi:nitrogen-specific signal transduction histidine kinase
MVLQHSFPDDLPPVKLTRQSLTQAVYNLVQNAGDSMRGTQRRPGARLG